MLELLGVRRRHRGAGEVLRGIDLSVAAGGPCVVLGDNGSGKSTLLRIAAGVSVPSAGSVSGRARVVGFVPAPFPASSRLSVRSYLRHLRAIHGRPARGPRAVDLLARLGFTGAWDRPVAELSTGNTQKVGLAQALSCDPGLVVLDEPWTGLDEPARVVLDAHLDDLSRSVPVLLSDHTGRAAALPGARVHRLRSGLLDARPAEVGPADAWPTDAGRLEARRASLIEVWCPGGVDDTLARVPDAVVVARAGSRVRVLVDAARSDAWVAAALGQGCSLLRLERPDGPSGPPW